jgi:thiol-disulfide isomerase/thioredoxin
MNQSKTFPWLGVFIFLFMLAGWLQPAATSTDINVKAIGEPELKSILNSHQGQLLLVNVWATWCKPCREEFPDLVRLQDFYKGKNVRVITISADYPDEIESKILPFLKKFNINFPVYVQNFPKQEDFINRMNKDWNGALPATFIYDKKGRQQVFFIGKKDFDSFREEIEKIKPHGMGNL